MAGFIYKYSDLNDDNLAITAVIRTRLTDNALTDEIQHLFKASPSVYRPGTVHFGSRFVFDGKGCVFFSIGDRSHGDDAQDMRCPNGKVHRINDDGSIPRDNPFFGRVAAVAPRIQFFHPLSGQLDDMMRTEAEVLVVGDPRFVAPMRAAARSITWG